MVSKPSERSNKFGNGKLKVSRKLKEFSYKEWKDAYHDLFQEPEREDIYNTIHLFILNILRSLGYVIK